MRRVAMAGGEPRAATPVTCATCELHAEAVFRVEGMDCNEEVVILERRLKPLAGMEAIAADVIGQRLHVKYDAAKLTTAAMVDAVGQTGMRMWLEHEAPRATTADVAWRLRLTVAAGLLIAGAFAARLLGQPAWAPWLLAGSAAVGAVYPARKAVTAVRTRTIDINVLMVVAVAGALALGEWMEAASVVFLFAVAQWLEVRTLERARQAIRALIDLSPRTAAVKRGGREEQVPVDEVRLGEEIVIRPGDKVPMDGVVAVGHSDVNEAPITGESLPVDKAPGNEVYAGTINGRGALEVTVTRVGRDTRLSRIIHLVEDAQGRRAPVQSFVDRFARVYTPIVIAFAALVAILPLIAGTADPGLWLYRALVLLVIACPCALVISTPVSIVSALSAAARQGVLVKGGVHLERLAEVSVIAFDKTGTLTRGRLRVTDVVPYGAAAPADVIRHAAAVEARSEHPIARALLAYARDLHADVPVATGFTSLPGLGAEGTSGGATVLIGNERLFEGRVPLPAELIAAAARLRDEGKSVVFIAVDGMPLGAIAVADQTHDTAREAIDLLRAYGIRRVVMLTGDHEATARAVAGPLGLDDVRYGLLPDQKHQLVEALRREHGPVLMVGDGVNDAPALAAADVGVAMAAAGSDAALETADVALMSGELLKLPYAIRLARATVRNVRTNVAVSLVLKALFLVLAVTGTATLWMAVLADTGASVIVIANALRLLRAR